MFFQKKTAKSHATQMRTTTAPVALPATESQPRVLGEISVNRGDSTIDNLKNKPVARRVNFALEETYFSILEEHEPSKTTAAAPPTSHSSVATNAMAASQTLHQSAPSAQAQSSTAPPSRFFLRPSHTQAASTTTTTTCTAAANHAVLPSPRSAPVVTLLSTATEPNTESRAPSTSLTTLTPRSAAGSVAPSSVASHRTGPFVVSNVARAAPFASSMEYNPGTRPTVAYLRQQQDQSGPLFTYYTPMHRRAHVPPGLPATYQQAQVCAQVHPSCTTAATVPAALARC